MDSDKISTSKRGKVSVKRRESSSGSNTSDNDKATQPKKKKTKLVLKRKIRNTSKHKYKKGRNRSSSSDSSTSEDSSTSSNSDSSSSSTSSEEERRRRKKKQKLKKLQKKAKKGKAVTEKKTTDDGPSNDIPLTLMDQRKSLAPMTKEEWEKRQSVVRRVYDETTGRHRLIKGDGEVIEEIVSKERHKEINKQATKGDGEYFQSQLRKM